MQYKFFENEEILLYYDPRKDKWFIKNKVNEIDYDLSVNNNLKSFLQIFYEDPSTFFISLTEKAKEKNISEKVLEELPFKGSIIFCVENKMFFWLELSLKWFEFMNIDDDLKKAINTVIADSKSPQSIRHKLMKAIKQ
jgi:hypothetical protein